MPQAFHRRVQNYLSQERIFCHGDKLVVGVSGGPDSVALLNFLSAVKDKYRLELVVVHVNYGLRGRESDQDEKFVRKVADRLGIPCQIFQYRRKKTDEASLRDFRYAMFENTRQLNQFDWIAVAHNQDDQVETFFLNLLRGAGTKGLSGMRSKRDRVIRPFLQFSRSEITDYLKKIKQPYRIDRTNTENYYLRNRIRNQLLPLLARQYNPRVRERIFALMENLRTDAQLVEEIGEKAYNSYVTIRRNEFILDEKDFKTLSKAVRRDIFRRIMGGLSRRELSLANVKEFEKMTASVKSKEQIMKIGTVEIQRRKGKIVLRSQ